MYDETRKNFCVVPFIHQTANNKGRARLCCVSMAPVIGDDGTDQYFDKVPLKAIWNTNFMRNIRKDFLAGKKPDLCKNCWHPEILGNRSKRLNDNEKFLKGYGSDVSFEVKKRIDEAKENDGFIKSDPLYFDLWLGDLCNIKCVTCNPHCSSQWAKEIKQHWKKIQKSGFGNQYQFIPQEANWFENPDYMSQFEVYKKSIVDLYIGGGEPTIGKSFLHFLNSCIDSGDCNHINLRFNTNLTNVNQQFYDIVTKFKSTRIISSIDAYGELNDFIRFPSKWKQINKNFEKLFSYPDNIHINVNTTVGAYNVMKLDELYYYYDRLKEKYGREINAFGTLLLYPSFMSATVLPAELKDIARERLTKCIDSRTDVQEKENLKSIMASLNTDNSHEFVKLQKHTRLFDDIRKSRAKELIPEIYNYGI